MTKKRGQMPEKRDWAGTDLPDHLKPVSAIGPIVSSAHLAEGGSQGLSEVEYGLILASHAFHRWMVRCMAAAGVPGLTPMEIMVLHTIRHRDRGKKLSDICLVLDIEDTHVATYAIRKLEAAGLVTTGRQGKEKTVRITPNGAEACGRYAQIRERLLVASTAKARPSEETLSEIAAVLRFLSGAYEQSARAATTL
ncbi:winged helix DNA-binding protein [Sinorhizobium fredii]|uniref:winged helix DNA-binding protein n=1 Tax=Rhizobium fredii TaxID=380 RepID=UPI0004B1B290|nr:winged helix DNA-binding protein [Sinorhizobium fredii]AWM29621.1 hypothetical protein AOX55_00006846 [Sinorhizobium fredii CCBAU 25509]MCG5473695.1 winged helix DNA-binding protein [Sinorhizobium fredii]